jgi:tetratricopeptide (TPR) repeat protein
MISSTSLDLPSHRKATMDAVLRAGCFPLAMEHGTATSDSDAIRFSLDLVDRADIYVGIFAQRYGFVPDNKKQNPQCWSVTEHEYRRAVARGIPRLIYLADKEHNFTVEEIDFDPVNRANLQTLKEELEAREICAFFPSHKELHSLVLQSLFEEKEKHGPTIPAEPSPVATVPHPPDLYAVPPYTLTNTFVGRRAELAELDAWATSTDRVLVVEAIGGMGKSALTWEWVQQHAETHVPGLAGRVWWSFYERGTSMKAFLRHTLAYVTQQDPETLLNLDTYDCGQQLLAELNRRPYLLVLDGFERVLTAYPRIDKAQLPDDKVPADKRETSNPNDGDVLRQLVHCGPSKVLVSTRLMPKVLEDRSTHRPIPGVRHLELAGLDPKDALRMVRNAGIRGNDASILQFAEQFGRHALVLRIVCGMITDYRPKPGDFDAWRADPYAGGGLKLSELELKQRYTHILEYAFRGLGEKTRQLLSRIAVLSDGADYSAIAALNPFLPPRPEEPKPRGYILGGLLLIATQVYQNCPSLLPWLTRPMDPLTATPPDQGKAIEARRTVYRKNPEPEYRRQRQAYEQYQDALQAYFASSEYQKARADFHVALSDLENRGLLQWDRETNAYDLHPVVRAYAFEQLEERDRAQAYNSIRDHFASLPPENIREATELAHVKNSLEIMKALIGAGRLAEASMLFQFGFGRNLLFSIGAYHVVTELLSLLQDNPSHALYLTNPMKSELAFAWRELGRLEDAIPLYRELIHSDLALERWDDLATSIRCLVICARKQNLLALSWHIQELAYRLAAAAGDSQGLTRSILEQAIVATAMGQFDEAESLFTSFQKRDQPPLALYRPGDAEYRLAALRFFQGKLTTDDLDQAERVATHGRNVFGQHRLAALRAEWQLTRDNPRDALHAIEHALSIIRRIGTPVPDYLGIRSLSLARLGQTAEACDSLAEAEDVWKGWTPQFPLFAAETRLALGDRGQAREFARQAYSVAWADGPPYIHRYYLKRCRELMAELGEPEPQLPPFDPNKVEPVPYEAEIRVVIERLTAERAKEKADEPD